MKLWQKNLILGIAVIFIAFLPFAILNGVEYAGSDSLAEEAILLIAPDYTPWYESWFKPAGGEVESFLFALQAAIGAGVLGFCLGRITARKPDGDKS